MSKFALPTDNLFKVPVDADIFKIKEKIAHQSTFNYKCSTVAHLILSAIVLPIGIFNVFVWFTKSIAPYFLLPGLDLYNLSEKTERHLKAPTARLHQEILDLKELYYYRDQFFADSKNCARQQTLRTSDKVNLDACVIENPNQRFIAPQDQKWIIYFHENDGCYEQQLHELKLMAEKTGANFLSANYRGFMRSQGYPTSLNDLVIDGETQVQYLKCLGIATENIILHGRGIGAAVATEVAINHQNEGHEINLCHERGFSTIGQVIGSRTTVLIGEVCGKLLSAAGWDVNSVKSFQQIKGKKWIVYTKEDGIVKYSASLYKSLKNVFMTDKDRADKALRDHAKKLLSYPKIKSLHNQEYKPKDTQCIKYSDKRNQKHVIKKYGDAYHHMPLSDSDKIFSIYANQVGKALDIEPAFTNKWNFSLYGSFRRLLSCGPY